jgi:hypothetical protein
MSEWIVASDALVGTSPMELPGRCVECGGDVSGGRRVDSTLYWYPRWIWVGILWGVIPVILLYYASRRPLKIGYSLCPKDDWSLRMRKRVEMVMGALFAAFLIAGVATHFNRFCMIAAIVLFIAALIVHFMAQVPLRAAGHEDGVFGVRGFSKDFLSTAKAPGAAEATDS